VPQDRIDLLAEIRRAVSVDVAMGDDQGGPGSPDALLLADAVDVVRIDAACAGGVTGVRSILERVRRAGKDVSFHIYGNMHAPIAAGLGAQDAWIEWSLPGTFVDAVTESLPLPAFDGDRLRVGDLGSSHEPGLGWLWDPDWLRDQPVDDPEGVLAW
jgi:L-alanine-DL-glutamate epimerase-like enolase superfamily enzyme